MQKTKVCDFSGKILGESSSMKEMRAILKKHHILCKLQGRVRFGDTVYFGTSLSIPTQIGNGTYIGNKVKIDYNVSIGEDVVIEDFAKIGSFTKIYDFVNIGKYVKIGEQVTIYNNVSIGQSAKIADCVSIYNNVYVGRKANIGRYVNLSHHVSIGYNTKIGDNIKLNPYTIIGDNTSSTKLNEEACTAYRKLGKTVIFTKWVTKDRKSPLPPHGKGIIYKVGETIRVKDAVKTDQQCAKGLHVFEYGHRPEWYGLVHPEHDLIPIDVEVQTKDILFAGVASMRGKIRVRALKVLT